MKYRETVKPLGPAGFPYETAGQVSIIDEAAMRSRVHHCRLWQTTPRRQFLDDAKTQPMTGVDEIMLQLSEGRKQETFYAFYEAIPE